MPVPTSQTTEYLYPDSIDAMTDTTANYASGFPAFSNDVYQNWYSDPLTTGQTPYQDQAYGYAMGNPTDQWATGPLQQAGDLYTQNAQYDPNRLQQFLNPYTQGANQATMDQVSRNLTENILPQVNSTFAGSGQFGSTRNADFNNRAIRDTQTGLAEALAKQNSANYTQANQNYLGWNQQGNQSAAGLAGVAGTGSTITQTGLTNMMTAAQAQQQQEQQQLDKSYQDYLTRQQYPLSALTSISGAAKNIGGIQSPNINTPVAQPDIVSKIMLAMQAMQNGLSDPAIQSILDQLELTNFNQGA